MLFDGYRIVREIHGSSRSHIYLAVDPDTDALVAVKISLDRSARRPGLPEAIHDGRMGRPPHRQPACPETRSTHEKRNYLYVVTEFIDGQTLTQWMIDNPEPELETVRGIVEQIAKGLRAFHRQEMLHQDLRPDNIMIDKTGTVKIIDFGATKITGVAEAARPGGRNDILGTAQYTAPEYFLGDSGSPRSDMFSLGVITYQMLTGKLPYGAEIAKIRNEIAAWQAEIHFRDRRSPRDSGMDRWRARKAVHPDPIRRYQSLSEYTFDLRRPNPNYLNASATPLIERNPLLFWKCTTAILAIIIVALLASQHGVHH